MLSHFFCVAFIFFKFKNLDGPEGSSGELDGVGGDLGEHVDSVIGHGPEAGAGGGEHGAGGADQVGRDLADKPRACNQHSKVMDRVAK